MEKSNKKAPIVFYIGIILLCIWLTSVYLIGGLYAKYSTYAGSSDSARVAKFSVNVINDTGSFPTEQTLDLSAVAGEDDVSWSFTIENNSEVVSEEKIIISFTESVPEWLTVSMTVNGEVCNPSIDGTTYTYVTEFPAGDSDTWVIKFIGRPDTAVYAEIDGQISVYVTQND